MSLKEVAEELKEKIAEAQKAEEAVVEEVEQPKAEEVKEEPKKEEVKEESKPEEVKAEEQPKKTAAEYAKERREKKSEMADALAHAQARIAALEASIRQPTAEVIQEDVEPNKADDPQAWTDWKLRKADEKLRKTEEKLNKFENLTEENLRHKKAEDLRIAALNEIGGYEAQVRQVAPDYDDVKGYYANMLAASIKIVNPKIANDKLVKIVEDRMISRAAELYNDGHQNPIAAMYEEAKALGYQPRKASNDEGKEVRPDLSKVAANRARNAGTAGAMGKGDGGPVTRAVAATLTNAEFARLPLAERKRLLTGA